jgi:hypothetical protein
MSLDMREPLGPVSVLPGIHNIFLNCSIEISTPSLLSIFPGMRSLAIHYLPERYTPATHPLHVMELPRLDMLAGKAEALSRLHPHYVRATLLEFDFDPECPSVLSDLLARAQPEILHLTPDWPFDPWRFEALPQVQMPSVVVLQLPLRCACGPYGHSANPFETFDWVRLSFLFTMSILKTYCSET